MTEEKPARFPRSFAIIFFGPLVGALAVLVWILIASLIDPPPGDDALAMIGMVLFIVIVFGWLTGLVPAILSAIVWKFVGPRVSGWRRVVSALAIGAVASMVGAWPIFILYFRATQITPEGLAVLAAIGAIAMAVTALPGKKPA